MFLRSLLRHPLLSIACILSLALGIGVNSSIFSLLDQVVFQLLPVRDPQRLVLLHNEGPRGGWSTGDSSETALSYPLYIDIRDRNWVFTGVAARAAASASLRHGNESERVRAEIVSGNFFELVGIAPAIGRTFTQEDDRAPGSNPVVMLSHGYYTRRFGANPSILNQTVLVNNQSMTVVGVLNSRFHSLLTSNAPDIYVPLSMKRQLTPTWDGLKERDISWLYLVGRLKPGFTPQSAEASLASTYRGILEEDLARMKNPSERFRGRFLASKLQLRAGSQGIHALRDSYQTPLIALMAMVGLVLLIACANVANLLLVKAAAQRRDIAIRFALGASRAQILKSVFLESLVLSSIGAILGLILSQWTTEALVKLSADDKVLSAAINPRMLLFTAACALLTALIFGLAPAFQAAGADVISAIKDQSGNIRSSSRQAGFRRMLVSAQMAFSLLLLIASGLFATNLYRLLTLDPGFRTSSLVQFTLSPTLSGYDQNRSILFFRDLLSRLAQLPGAQSVAASALPPLSGSSASANVTVEGYKAGQDEDTNVHTSPIGPNYFTTLGIPLRSGRDFNNRDIAGAPKVVIVNEEFASHFLGNRNPIGAHMTFGAGDVKLDREIVGVVANSKNDDLKSAAPRMVYSPYEQEVRLEALSFFIRTGRDTDSLGADIRSVVRQMDANVPIFELATMQKQLEKTLGTERLLAFLSNAFGLLATLLAAVGLYGVISHSIAMRTGEIGIRIALGSTRSGILKLVLREVAALALAGVGAGLVLALFTGTYIESQLYQLKASNPVVLVASTAVLLLVAFCAGLIPALRASRIDPMRALRNE